MIAGMPVPIDADAFEELRPTLFGVAYRMLGSASEAEDIVQEAFIRARTVDTDGVRSLKAYLVTIVTRLCLDQLKSAHVRREQYVGPWLPEPLPTGPDTGPEGRVTAAESISFAFLVLLEVLGPVERAVFLLREVFDYGYDEVAAMVGRTEAACRQTFRRARQRLDERRPRYAAAEEDREQLTVRFITAVSAGNMQGLLSMLTNDVALMSDGGGKVAAALNSVHGRDHVARLLLGLASRADYRAMEMATVELGEVNGGPALICRSPRGRVTNVMIVEAHEGGIGAVYIMRNPEKLGRFASGVVES